MSSHLLGFQQLCGPGKIGYMIDHNHNNTTVFYFFCYKLYVNKYLKPTLRERVLK